MLSFWPGFQGIARYGLRSQLGLAILFALILDAFLIVNFYWTSLLTIAQRNLFLGGVLVAWLLLLSFSRRRLRTYEINMAIDEKDEHYRTALQHYLRRNWFEAESLIVPYLKKKPRDIEMQLLQATLYRRTGRLDEAVCALERIRQFDGSGRWTIEIEMEYQSIEEIRAERAEAEAERLAEVESLAQSASFAGP